MNLLRPRNDKRDRKTEERSGPHSLLLWVTHAGFKIPTGLCARSESLASSSDFDKSFPFRLARGPVEVYLSRRLATFRYGRRWISPLGNIEAVDVRLSPPAETENGPSSKSESKSRATRRPSGYFESFQNLERELLEFVEAMDLRSSVKTEMSGKELERRRMPTQKELEKAKRFDLMGAIRRHGGTHVVGKRCSLDTQRQAKKPWLITRKSDLTILREQVLQIAQELGKDGFVPTYADLIKLKRTDVLNAVRAMGGFHAAAKRLGLKSRRPRRNWKSAEVVEEEIRNVIISHPFRPSLTLPSRRQLLQHGRGDLVNAIQLHGGLRYFGERLKIPSTGRRQSNGCWNDIKRVEAGIREFQHSRGLQTDILPSQREFRLAGRCDLVYAIRIHGGSIRVAQLCGFRLSLSRRPRNYWSDFNILAGQLHSYMHQFGYQNVMPRIEDLKKHRRMDLVYAIDRFGGAAKVSQSLHLTWMGPSSYWREFSNLKKRLLFFIRCRANGDHRTMPNVQELHQSGRLDLIQGIEFHGGVVQVANRIGRLQVSYPEYPPEYFRNAKNIDSEITSFLLTQPREKQRRMPTAVALVKSGRADLADAIRDNGGWMFYAQRLGLLFGLDTQRRQGYWADQTNVVEELRSYLSDRAVVAGKMPSLRLLEKDGRADIAFAIQRYHTSAEEVAAKLQLQLMPDPVDLQDAVYFDNKEVFVRSMSDWIVEHGIDGIMPSREDFIRTGRHDLRNAVIMHGGRRAVAVSLDLVCEGPGWVALWLGHQAGKSFYTRITGTQRIYVCGQDNRFS